MPDVFLPPREVTARYKGSPNVATLANWRHKKHPPKYYKVRGRILYKLSDLIEWEESLKK